MLLLEDHGPTLSRSGVPFDFYLSHYKEQLVTGYTEETPSFGLRVYMRDYNKLHATRSRSAPNR